ncbi:CHAT domain-containing protein [Micromonospora ureilytica]|uniref:CHAT domain-containing protein n=1 Tax=Micromonospora ureilytica TaxID=709868 RepID=UPI002E13F818|nr:CHAT domain-containing protein [Micromonospora ureilytica]
MVSIFLSYPARGDSVVAGMLDDALTARFGDDGVARSLPSANDSHAELRHRLAASAALIVVIEPRARATVDASLDTYSGLVSWQVRMATTLEVPVIPVLVTGPELLFETDVPEALRPLSHQRSRRIRLGRVREDIRRLIDDLGARFDPETGAAEARIPLILSEEPVHVAMPRRTHGPSVATVYRTRDGELVEAPYGDPPNWSPEIDARYAVRYEVDTRQHSIGVNLRLPSNDARFTFEASIVVGFQVTDPTEVVRHPVRFAVPLLRDFLQDFCEAITRRFSAQDGFEASLSVGQRLERATLPAGIALYYLRVRLTADGHTDEYVRALDEVRLDPLGHEKTTSGSISFGNLPNRSSPGSRPPPDRMLVARAPTQVPTGQDLSVDVRLVTKGRSVHPDAVTAWLPNLHVADAGTPVTVTVHGPAGLHAEGPLQQTLLVTPGEDPAPIRFGFGARTPGLHRIDVTAWAGGTFLAEVSVEVSVADSGPFRDGRPQTALLGAPRARPGEVTMEVRFDGSRYTFQLRSDTALFAPVVESFTNTPNAAVENAIRELQQLAGGGSRYSATMTREVIRSAGIQLWSEMVPADVRDQFWQVGAGMSAFTIATDHDVVPWELLYPLSAQRDAGFLVEQVPVVRRTYGQHRAAKVGLRNPRFVVPRKAPTGAHEEIATIRAILDAADSEPITSADELHALITSGRLGATHFACHNTFSSDGSYIDMDDGRFTPSLLTEARVRKLLTETSPLVFINACRSAGVAPTYTRMLGWAQQFMSSGAGAFVGTLWAVRSDSSARFATAFYRSLAEGATLGAAALAARTDQQDDPLDPTRLAYTVYGDPFATAAV